MKPFTTSEMTNSKGELKGPQLAAFAQHAAEPKRSLSRLLLRACFRE
jgi:hypothetical protein